MKRRKLLALLMALSLALSLVTPVSADETTGEYAHTGTANETVAKETTNGTDSNKIEHSSVLYAPTMKITISAPPTIVVNPYRLKFSATTGSSAGDGTSQAQIICAPTSITNETNLAITVKATPTADVIGVTLSDKATVTGTTPPDKGIYLELRCATCASDATDTQVQDALAADTAKKAAIKENTEGITPESVEFDLSGTTQRGVFDVTGGTHTAADEKWTSGDKVDVNIVFEVKAMDPPTGG